jgi:predicted O-methyltransferase YrrM
MRSIRHLTPRYIFNRLAEINYQQRFPDLPWLTREANEILERTLNDVDAGLEFGSGRSTLWLALRIKKLTSVEHNKEWYGIVKRSLEERGIKSVNLLLFESSNTYTDESGENTEYVSIIDTFSNKSLDFVLIDGIFRADCANNVIPKLKPGGLLVIDNVNRFLPNDSTHSPNSRITNDGPASDKWKDFMLNTKGWDYIWTSSGVTDTVLYFNPK